MNATNSNTARESEFKDLELDGVSGGFPNFAPLPYKIMKGTSQPASELTLQHEELHAS